MPYIKQDRREEIDDILESFIHKDIKADGDLNYLLYKFCKYGIKPSYNNYKNFCGELRQCATEIERTLLADYENKKRMENGRI